MIDWPETLEATEAATTDDLNLVTHYNLLLEASMSLELKNTALTTRVTDLETTGQGETRGLKIRQSRISPNTDVFITAEQLRLTTGAVIPDIDVVADLGDAGAGGLDTGTVAANTWYYFFVINDSTEQEPDRALISASASPLLPTGYDRRTDPLLLVPSDSEKHLHAFAYLAGENTTILSSNESDVSEAGSPLSRIDLTSVGGSWGAVDLSAMRPPGVEQVLARFLGVGNGAITELILYGKPTWAGDTAASPGTGISYQRRLFEFRPTGGVFSSMSPDRWIELDDDGQYSFREGPDAWTSLYVSLVGYKFVA